ncbi:glycosyltransferase family 1 protein [Parafrigoribacterium mesophilum]|uniref:glycosyltransferase family 4 protein n=1 Tax=Parafrigoribacterium mesophilum TaxID=433646 RepID=UPI0031FCE0F1
MPAPLTIVDASAIPRDRGGVGRYVDGLVSGLHGPIVIVCQTRDRDIFASLLPAARIVPLPRGFESTAMRLLWEQFGLPRLAARVHAEVIHSPHYTVPLFTRRARVVTFHDATFFSDPKLHTRLKRWFFRTWVRVSERLAREIMVPSKATAHEFSRYLGVAPERFTVAYHGVDQALFRPPTKQEISRARTTLLDGESQWVGFLGTIEPRKNIPALIRAYFRLVVRLVAERKSVPSLALAGGKGWEQDIESTLAAAPAEARVAQLGFVPTELLPGFLGGAVLIAYPSLGEGFGLPILEAMSCAAPVLTTRALALPEVGGDAVYYSATDEESLSAALYDLVTDSNLRTALSKAGPARAKQFTWKASALIHEAAYERAVTHG